MYLIYDSYKLKIFKQLKINYLNIKTYIKMQFCVIDRKSKSFDLKVAQIFRLTVIKRYYCMVIT